MTPREEAVGRLKKKNTSTSAIYKNILVQKKKNQQCFP